MIDKDFTGEQENEDTMRLVVEGGAALEEQWRKVRRRENALGYAVATAGKNPKVAEVIERAEAFLAFLEG